MTTIGIPTHLGKLVSLCVILSVSTIAKDFTQTFWPEPLKIALTKSSSWGDPKVMEDAKLLWKDRSVTLNATTSNGTGQWACFAKRNGFYYSPHRACKHINQLPSGEAKFFKWCELLGMPEAAIGPHEGGVIICHWSLWNGKLGTELELLEICIGRKLNDQVVFGVISKGRHEGNEKGG